MPSQVFRCPAESTCVVVAHTSKNADKLDFMSLLGTTIADMDGFYFIDWEEWFEAIDDGYLCVVAKVECGSEDGGEGEEGDDVDDLDQPTDAPQAKKGKPSETTPRALRKPTSQKSAQTPSVSSAMDALLPRSQRNKSLVGHFHALIS